MLELRGGCDIDAALEWLMSSEGIQTFAGSVLRPSNIRHHHRCSYGHLYVEYRSFARGHDGSAGHDKRCPVPGCPHGDRAGVDATGASVIIGTNGPDVDEYVFIIGDLVVVNGCDLIPVR